MRSTLLAATLLASACCVLPVFAQQPAPVVPAEAGVMPQGKLDGTVVPAAYRLDLTVDPAKERFSGHVEIDATLNCGKLKDARGAEMTAALQRLK